VEVGEGSLQWFSLGGEGTYGCGGPWSSSSGSQFDLGHDVLARWRADQLARVLA
jgi:hypothetical protein